MLQLQRCSDLADIQNVGKGDSVVNIVGDVDLGALSDIGASIGVPEMVIGSTELEKLKVDLPPPSR